MNKSKLIYVFQAELEVRPKRQSKQGVTSSVAVMGSQSLSTLARAIIESFEFDFDHCYGFYSDLEDIYSSSEIYELFTDIPQDPNPGTFGVTHAKVSKAFDKVGKKLLFLFDYGDSWQFIVTLIEVQHNDGNSKYPKVLKFAENPPEQYPETEAEFDEEEDHDQFSDDCELCRQLRQQGVKLQWFPDKPIKKKIVH